MKHLLTVILLSFLAVGAFAKEYPVFTIDYSSSIFQLAPDSTDTCLGVVFTIYDTVWAMLGDTNQGCNQYAEIHIGVSGGTLPYSFYWTGPNNYTSTVQNPQDIPHQGTNTLVVTDSLGCTGNHFITVGGVGVQ